MKQKCPKCKTSWHLTGDDEFRRRHGYEIKCPFCGTHIDKWEANNG